MSEKLNIINSIAKGDKRILLSEFHDGSAMNFLADNIPDLKEAGRDKIYLEIDSLFQPLIAAYDAGKVNDAQMRSALNKAVVKNDFDQAMVGGTMEILKSAKENGVKVIAYDVGTAPYIKPEKRNKFFVKKINSNPKHQKNFLNAMNEFIESDEGKTYEDLYKKYANSREDLDARLAGMIKDLDEEGKGVILIGMPMLLDIRPMEEKTLILAEELMMNSARKIQFV